VYCECVEENRFGNTRHVGGDGNANEPRLAIIGEAPGAEEDQEGVPFVGGAGRILGRWLHESGIFRGECYIDNVFQHRPPGNNLDTAKPLYQAANESLWKRLATVRPRVVVAAGETALNAFGKTGIHNWRGSSFLFRARGAEYWVVPTLHPAFIMRQQTLWRFCVGDIRYAARECQHRMDPILNYTVNPTPSWLGAWAAEIKDGDEVSLDLETTYDFGAITQVSLSTRPHEAVCFDMEEEYLIPLLRLLKRPLRWVGQNIIMFDSIRLRELGAALIPCSADVMLAHYLLESPAPHDLGFINGQWVHYPYYKDEISRHRHLYACKDADVTLQAWRCARAALAAEGMDNLFRVIMAAAHHMRKVALRGVPVDKELVVREARTLQRDADEVVAKIRAISGLKHFNPRSFVDCKALLYDKLKLPPMYNRKKDPETGRYKQVLTTDDDALVKLMRYHEVPKLILQYRRPANDVSKYFRPETVKDGKWYLDWKLHGTETGRYSCWFHTIPPRARHVVRDPGRRIAYADAQQGEFRIAAWCANDPKAKEVLASPLGVHNANACLVFQCTPQEVTPMRKFYAKFTTYGWLYGRGPDSVQEQYGVPKDRALEIINTLNTTYTKILQWRNEVARHALRHGFLRSPDGGKRFFPDGSDADKEREAFAFIPQRMLHTCTQRAHILVEEHFTEDEVRVIADMHDALLMSVDPSFDGQRLKDLISIEYFEGLTMPFDYEVNDYWMDKREEQDKAGRWSVSETSA
jgi:uracil-DNA glycosylase family 4